MARDRAVEMPISAAVVALLGGKATVDGAIESLLTRPIRSEA
jgi:glycerol-3-phosphate dehydrogenase (NAD(P)+)